MKATPTLTQVTRWAKDAGKMLLNMQFDELDIQYKGKADLLTKADKASESYLLGEITQHFPDHQIVAEESGWHSGDADHQWFIDPLDGTLNYSHGLRVYAVSVAYAYKGELKLGVVYAPALDEFFTAEAGKGAKLNGKQIHVSEVPDLIDAMLVTGFRFHDPKVSMINVENFLQLSQLCQTVRRYGSAALDACYVACGRFDGCWDMSSHIWDHAAGTLVAMEAGAIATPIFNQGSLILGDTDLLIANPSIHPQMRKELMRIRREEVEKSRRMFT